MIHTAKTLLTASKWQMQGAMESCPFKTVMSGGMGFALGGAFGLFMSSVCGAEAEGIALT